jgi:hypothetical protein
VEKDTTHVALDDSERKIVAGILGREATEPEVQIPNDPRHIRRLFDRLKAEERVQACYEAGCVGVRPLPAAHRTSGGLPEDRAGLEASAAGTTDQDRPAGCRHEAKADQSSSVGGGVEGTTVSQPDGHSFTYG